MTTEPTYQEMAIEHLGDIATEQDLTDFRGACAAYQDSTGASDLEATDYIWDDGDWLRRALKTPDGSWSWEADKS